MNKVILAGNLGADGELKVTQSGTSILKLRLATTERWKDRDGNRQEKVEWNSITMFGKGADALHPYMDKGKGLVVEGKIQTSTYEKDGEKRYRTEIVANNIEFAPGGGGGNRGGGGSEEPRTNRQRRPEPPPPTPDPGEDFPVDDDDIPF